MSLVAPVSRDVFCSALLSARSNNPLVHQSTTAPDDLPSSADYYLNDTRTAGLGITDDGTLIALFNTSGVSGLGRELVGFALDNGAIHLDCFDGFLVGYYRSLGFVETHREPNWTEGEPDVVFMTRPASSTD